MREKQTNMEAKVAVLTCAGESSSIGRRALPAPWGPESTGGQKWGPGDRMVGPTSTDTLCVYSWHLETMKVARQD